MSLLGKDVVLGLWCVLWYLWCVVCGVWPFLYDISGVADEKVGWCLLSTHTGRPSMVGAGGKLFQFALLRLLENAFEEKCYETFSNLKRSPRSHNCREIRYIINVINLTHYTYNCLCGFHSIEYSPCDVFAY